MEIELSSCRAPARTHSTGLTRVCKAGRGGAGGAEGKGEATEGAVVAGDHGS